MYRLRRLYCFVVFSLVLPAASISQWTQANGPAGGRISSLAIARSSSGTSFYAGTNGGGLFKSTGTAWSIIDSARSNLAFFSLALIVDSTGVKPTTIFAGTNGSGVFISSDDGSTWTPSDSGMLNGTVQALAIKDTLLFAGTLGGVYRSADRGIHWYGVGDGLLSNFIYALAVVDSMIFAGTPLGVFRSLDDGWTWHQMDTGLSVPNTVALAACKIGQKAFVYAGTAAGIFRSTDGAVTWQAADSGLSTSTILSLAALP